jgi:hypothetical protein
VRPTEHLLQRRARRQAPAPATRAPFFTKKLKKKIEIKLTGAASRAPQLMN